MRNSSVTILGPDGRWGGSRFVESVASAMHAQLRAARAQTLIVQFPFWRLDALKSDSDLRRCQLVSETAMRWVASAEVLGLTVRRVFARAWQSFYVQAGRLHRDIDERLDTRGLAIALTGLAAAEVPIAHADSICIAYWGRSVPGGAST